MDLNAMKMYHPFVIDTSCLYNLSGQKHCKSNLKTLASVFLNRSIQRNGCLGHNPREDAEAVMMLNNNSSDNKVDEVVIRRGVNRDNDNDEDISDGISCNVASKDNNNNNNNVDDVTHEDKCSQPQEPENHRHLDDKQQQQQISMFFRLNKHTTSLFKLLVRDRKKAAILGLPNFLTSLKQQHNSINTNDPDFKQFIKVIKDGDDDYDGGDDENEDGDVLDKKMMRRCREELESGDSSFLIGRFCSVGRSLDCTENKVHCARCLKRSLKSTDKHIKKLYNALPEKSLMIVLLAGRSSGPDNFNGLCLVKVKTAQ
ncbi:hypothetical protein HELRODRAFT_159979 [Helobdella robusta]|uniref:Uncharacterized protein n=1 Tax=Helobdella robusta TaxID=6412 RepID=T1EPM2_HELRO|nr:hypothetical protein HELRODRAFT_159979 [Helobdella robusta]ESO05893.1 hypothetical protein HELRODRAFT_159979 [Helobdella robusta]